MRYHIGIDPETDELMVGDSESHILFLRGPASEREAVVKLVGLANRAAEAAEGD